MAGNELVSEEVEELKRAQATLQHRVDALYSQIAISVSHQKYVLEAEEDFRAKTRRRILLFARKNAVQELRLCHSELSQKYSTLCPGNSVRQVLLRTKASDCTLADFRVLVSALVSSLSIKCEVFPSEFYTHFLDTGSAQCFHVSFDTYFDICEALEINVKNREEGLYRSRKDSSRQLRAVQVMGVDILPSRDHPENTRRICSPEALQLLLQTSKSHFYFRARLLGPKTRGMSD